MPSRISASEVHYLRLPDRRFERIIAATRPDWLIHCAGTARVAASFANPQTDFLSNVTATESIYRALAAQSPETRVVFLSSAAVYGNPPTLPITLATEPQPISPYGVHKRQCELIGDEFRAQHHLSITTLRIFSAYGPGLAKQVMWDIYRKACHSNEITLHGTGRETRDFLHSSDISSVISRIIESGRSQDVYLNLASGSSVSIRELADRLLSALGRRCDVVFSGQSAPGTPEHWSVAVPELEALGHHDFVPLSYGLADYASWLKSLPRGAGDNRDLAAAG